MHAWFWKFDVRWVLLVLILCSKFWNVKISILLIFGPGFQKLDWTRCNENLTFDQVYWRWFCHTCDLRRKNCARASKISCMRLQRLIHIQNPYLFHAYAFSVRINLRGCDRKSGFCTVCFKTLKSVHIWVQVLKNLNDLVVLNICRSMRSVGADFGD